MFHTYATTLGLALAMLGIVSTLGFVPVALANDDRPGSRNVVATVITIGATTDMATLRTEEGEVFEHPEGWQWHVGHKVVCERIDGARPRFLNCRIWESAHASTGASRVGLAPRR